jgi:hypothetical protein
MTDVFLIGSVLGLRFVVPLTILRYPLPGLVAAILADGIDGAVLRGYTSFDVELYQQFDKAFDALYLVFAYVATLRNWTNPTAVVIGRWLFYFRLIGVALFATSGSRALLFVFPAMFEFYFLGVELHRSRWNPARLTAAHLVTIASVAWVLKLPQEYWLHIAQQSTTDWVKQHVFGMDPSVSRLDVIAAHPWVVPALVAIAAALVLAVRLALRVLPPPDHPTSFDADRLAALTPVDAPRRGAADGVFSPQLVDKLAIVSLVGIAYSEFLPDVHTNAAQLAIGVGALVIASTVVGERLARYDLPWRSPAAQFAILCAVNAPMMFALVVLRQILPVGADLGLTAALAYVVIVSMVIAVYDGSREATT